MTPTERRYCGGLALVYALSRVVAHVAGVRFDAEPLEYYYQYLDPELLRTSLLESVAHLHTQPPLFNLWLGLGLKLFPDDPTLFYHATYIALSAAMGVGLFLTMSRSGVAMSLSAALTAIFLVSPACILYENLLFYTHPVQALVVLAVFFGREYLAGSRIRDVFLFALFLSGVALTRSLFHVGWLLALLGVVALARPAMRNRAVLASAVPVLLVVAWYARTFVLFGSFAASSWLGMSVARVTVEQGSIAERSALVADGTLSDYALIPPFQDLDRYAGLLQASPASHVSALQQVRKSNGHRNLNHAAYLAVSDAYARDAAAVLVHRPAWLIRGLRSSTAIYFHPTSSDEFLARNRRHLATWDRVYRIPHWPKHVLVALVFVLVVLAAARLLWRAHRRREFSTTSNVLVCVLFLHVLYVFVVGNLLEVGENYRFRYVTFSAQLVLFALLWTSSTAAGRARLDACDAAAVGTNRPTA